jgi:glycine/D-amino acid oxidase-like deaminating enzyme
MLNRFEARGGVLHVGCRVAAVVAGAPCTVVSSHGIVQADHVVVATGTPSLGRRGQGRTLMTVRSYAIACRLAGPVPQGLYVSVDDPVRTLRPAGTPLGELLVVGGTSHVAGQGEPDVAILDLERWTERYFPEAEVTHAWSLQEYRSSNTLPYVSALAGSGGQVLVAIGYDKWGMTNGVAAALRMAGEIKGARPGWGEQIRSTASPERLSRALSFGVPSDAAPPCASRP